jgi:hypothetical protein
VVCAFTLQSVFTAMLASFLCQMCFWGVHYIALEMEGPYGGEANDLCLEEMQSDINRSLLAIAHPLALKTPTFVHDYDHPLATVSLDLDLELERVCEKIEESTKRAASDINASILTSEGQHTQQTKSPVRSQSFASMVIGAAEHLTKAATLKGQADGGAPSKPDTDSWLCVHGTLQTQSVPLS